MHHKYKDRGQGLSIRVKHRKFMDHTRSIHPTPRIALSVTKFQLHHTHMQHSQALWIHASCIFHIEQAIRNCGHFLLTNLAQSSKFCGHPKNSA